MYPLSILVETTTLVFPREQLTLEHQEMFITCQGQLPPSFVGLNCFVGTERSNTDVMGKQIMET